MSKENKSIHYKATSLLLDTPTVTSRKGTAQIASFNTIDNTLDVIRRGAFSKSISERGPASNSNRKIKMLHQHNVLEPFALITKLYETIDGLFCEFEIENTPLGDVILERYKNTTYREHSFGFSYVMDKCKWIEMPLSSKPEGLNVIANYDLNTGAPLNTFNVFECKELKLYECSVVTFGCNEDTPFLGFKGNTTNELSEQLTDELKYLIKNAPNYEYELLLRNFQAKQLTLAENLTAVSIKDKAQAEFNKLAENINKIKQFNFIN